MNKTLLAVLVGLVSADVWAMEGMDPRSGTTTQDFEKGGMYDFSDEKKYQQFKDDRGITSSPSIEKNITLNAKEEKIAFMHNFSHSSAEALYVLKPVYAKIDKGDVVFINDGYAAVTAYIHDNNGNIIKELVIPGSVDSDFTAAYSAIKDTIPAFFTGLVTQDQKFKPLGDYFSKGSAMEYNSHISMSELPKGAGISYVSGTDKAVLATYVASFIKYITLVVDKATFGKVDDGLAKEISNEVLKAALTDAELLNKVSTYDRNDASMRDILSELADWTKDKGLKKGMEVVLSKGFPYDAKLLDDIFKASAPLKALGDSLVGLSQLRDAALAPKSLLWYDMAYVDDEDKYLEDQYKFNWLGTKGFLDNGNEVIFTAKTNEHDNTSNWWNPNSWFNDSKAMYKRFSVQKISQLNTPTLPSAPREPDPSFIHQMTLGSLPSNSDIGSPKNYMVNNTDFVSMEDIAAGFKQTLIATNGIGGKSTNTNPVQTGQQQSMFVNTQPFSSTDWIVKEGASNNFVKTNSFGSVVAPENKLMAALNNANAAKTVVERTFTVPTGIKSVSLGFNANFITNEFPAFVGSQFNDNVKVEVITASGNSYDIKTPFKESLNASQLQPVTGLPNPMMADGGQTGFKPVDVTNIPLAGGGAVTVRVTVENVGDQLYPSAALISDTQAKPR